MNVHSTILSAIGHTPLVRLNKLVGPNDATVYAKCEFLNPGGSIKDRMALYIIEKAEREGKLKPGGVIVENTSGNTGMGVALAAAVKGYRCIFTMPDKMSAEKINRLKALGAQVVVTPTNVPADSPQSYYETAKRIARETPGSFYLNQYHNTDNGEAHYLSTAPELWEQLEGRLDAFVTGLGTGGTMTGVGKFLKEKNPAIRNVGVDPIGSVYQGYFQTGKLPEPHVYKVEGIGEDMLCKALDFSVIDEIRQVDDQQSFNAARRLAREEGLFGGGSSGSAVHVALEVARELGKGKVVAVVLTDTGNNYITKFFADEWMKDNGFAVDDKSPGRVKDRHPLAQAGGPVHRQGPSASTPWWSRCASTASARCRCVTPHGATVGMIHEYDLLNALVSKKQGFHDIIDPLIAPLQGVVSPTPR